MREQQYFDLASSEAAIAASASRFLAAWIAAGMVSQENEAEFLNRSVSLAIRLSRQVDEAVQSAGETSD